VPFSIETNASLTRGRKKKDSIEEQRALARYKMEKKKETLVRLTKGPWANHMRVKEGKGGKSSHFSENRLSAR